MARRLPIARQVNGVVFGLSTPRRHGNSKSSNALKEAGLSLKLERPSKGLSGKTCTGVIKDDLDPLS